MEERKGLDLWWVILNGVASIFVKCSKQLSQRNMRVLSKTMTSLNWSTKTNTSMLTLHYLTIA